MTAATAHPLSFEDYSRAREALDRLVQERAAVLPRGLDALRRWLAAGAGERWLHYEAVVTQAREQDLALAMWWESEWRRERNQRRRSAKMARRRPEPPPAPKPVAPTKAGVPGNTPP